MKTTLIILLALLSIFSFTVNGQSSIVCTDRKEDNYTDSIMTIYAVLCGDDDSIYLEISSTAYTGQWFGIVFGSNMNGQSVVYTTGESDDRNVTLSSYTLAKPNTNYDNWDWDEVYTNTSDGIHIIYKTLLSNTDYTLSTASIPMRHAYGSPTSTLQLAYHGSGRYSSAFTMTFAITSEPTTATPTTAAPTPATMITSEPTTAAPTTTTAAPVDVCTNGNEATVSDDTMTIRVVLCADDDMIYLDVTYPDYSDVWFGVVFSTNMIGDAAIYTTGKANDRALAMYPYEVQAIAKTFDLSGIVYDTSIVWTEELVDTTNGIQVIYKTALSNYGFTTSTESISIRYAYGSSTQLAVHARRSDAAQTLDFTGTATTTTTTAAPGAKGCDAQDLVPSSATLDDFAVTFFLNCEDDTVTVTIKYSGYNDNWFGIVFSADMIGDALIYTTGKSGDKDVGLYPYILSSRNTDTSGVNIDDENGWTKLSEEVEDGTITVQYKQHLDKTSFTRETEQVPFRWGKGSSLTLAYHGTDGKSLTGANLNLLTGGSSTITDDLTAQTAHGVIMWFAWAILASWGIMSSRFRWLYPKGPIWFKIHRGVQAFVVILDIAGFIIAVVFTADRGVTHFSNPHMILGLVVTILAILQPINALFRAHPPADGWPNGEKPMKRVVWEFIHKGFGYIAWILGCVTVMLGLQLLAKDLLAKLHMYLWCGLMLVAYIILSIVGYLNAKKEAQTKSVPANEDDADGVGTTR